MDFRYLKAFIATAKHGSFSKAAEELNIAQSAVSRQIKLLEESINDELILRSSKQITLTPKGKEIFEIALGFVNQIDEALEEDHQKEIRVGIIHGLLENWFPDVLLSYYQKFDNNVKISIANFQKLQDRLSQGKYDIIFTPFNVQNDIMTSRLIFEESRKIASAKPIDMEKLHEERWIIYNQEDLILKISKKHSRRIIEVNSITSMLRFVKEGLGIAVLPDHMLRFEPDLNVVELPKHDKSPIYMSTLNYTVMPGYLKALIDEIVQQPPH
ncbi:LysR family transcriptional regulator [Pseudobacteriovorax antillogorgiicola]|uniref:DNA-binding transcriptional regulator, LysR family n=1 Tax=Pseudobacteriovorax antillogorgiicola TaxID=1513793 RepID=A0A1Y6BDA4_9BACT|nr:LysR family transcriptional regulator [Pseudobacteriovorax antillogorgiicola]TCS56445.1 DNA-binding transcriptional LysR family regulator [Pseudobacteriovorax antillogorgiicola]SMF05374.1 DNA-binding transcriptional regulator, LysR family [Pseudobacteriovorax antillogorgiicola]